MIFVELGLILFLIVLNGFLAMSELAIVSARKFRLQALADQKVHGAQAALLLAEDPGRFISMVQIGITLIGVLAGALGGAALSAPLAKALTVLGVEAGLAQSLAFGTVVALITFLSIIIGEVVPKQLALRDAERMACIVAPIMGALSRIARPFVTVVDASAGFALRLAGARDPVPRHVSDEEIRMLIAEAERAGVVMAEERDMIGAVMRLSDRRVRGLMTPRTEIDWIDLDQGEAGIRRAILATKHSWLPVARGSVDHIEGIVHIRDILEAQLEGKPLDVTGLIRTPPVFHEMADALFIVQSLRDAALPVGLILDEYGSVEGLVTRADILEAIIGEMKEAGVEESLAIVKRDDGSFLIDGAMPADEMAEGIGYRLPEHRDYQTVAGFMLAEMRQLPKTGDKFTKNGWCFEVVDMDGRRVDKILAVPTRAKGRI